MSLLEKIKKDRQLDIKFKHMTFHTRRPTYEEIGTAFTDKHTNAEICRTFVIGWDGVKESDLIKSGEDKEIPFDIATWLVAVGDMKEVCEHLVGELVGACMKYHGDMEDSAKN